MDEDKAPDEQQNPIVEMICTECSANWLTSVKIDPDLPFGAVQAIALTCPNCGKKHFVPAPKSTIHFIVTYMNGAVWVKPSKAIMKNNAIRLLEIALDMTHGAAESILLPEEYPLRAWVTVDEMSPDDLDWGDDGAEEGDLERL